LRSIASRTVAASFSESKGFWMMPSKGRSSALSRSKISKVPLRKNRGTFRKASRRPSARAAP
jgi:hypothetical protein